MFSFGLALIFDSRKPIRCAWLAFLPLFLLSSTSAWAQAGFGLQPYDWRINGDALESYPACFQLWRCDQPLTERGGQIQDSQVEGSWGLCSYFMKENNTECGTCSAPQPDILCGTHPNAQLFDQIPDPMAELTEDEINQTRQQARQVTEVVEVQDSGTAIPSSNIPQGTIVQDSSAIPESSAPSVTPTAAPVVVPAASAKPTVTPAKPAAVRAPAPIAVPTTPTKPAAVRPTPAAKPPAPSKPSEATNAYPILQTSPAQAVRSVAPAPQLDPPSAPAGQAPLLPPGGADDLLLPKD